MIKEKIKKWLEKVTEENKAQFGQRRLDCCDLNQIRRSISIKKSTGKNYSLESDVFNLFASAYK